MSSTFLKFETESCPLSRKGVGGDTVLSIATTYLRHLPSVSLKRVPLDVLSQFS